MSNPHSLLSEELLAQGVKLLPPKRKKKKQKAKPAVKKTKAQLRAEKRKAEDKRRAKMRAAAMASLAKTSAVSSAVKEQLQASLSRGRKAKKGVKRPRDTPIQPSSGDSAEKAKSKRVKLAESKVQHEGKVQLAQSTGTLAVDEILPTRPLVAQPAAHPQVDAGAEGMAVGLADFLGSDMEVRYDQDGEEQTSQSESSAEEGYRSVQLHADMFKVEVKHLRHVRSALEGGAQMAQTAHEIINQRKRPRRRTEEEPEDAEGHTVHVVAHPRRRRVRTAFVLPGQKGAEKGSGGRSDADSVASGHDVSGVTAQHVAGDSRDAGDGSDGITALPAADNSHTSEDTDATSSDDSDSAAGADMGDWLPAAEDVVKVSANFQDWKAPTPTHKDPTKPAPSQSSGAVPSPFLAAGRAASRRLHVSRIPSIQAARMKLPVCQQEQELTEALFKHPVLVVCGATGSGKTTQIPQFLVEAGVGWGPSVAAGLPEATVGLAKFPGRVAVTQPRRVAAVSTATRVADELNAPMAAKRVTGSKTRDREDREPVLSGTDKEAKRFAEHRRRMTGLVGYQIRYERRMSPATRLLFMTDGVLLQRVQSDFLLLEFSFVVIDEAHERNLNTDVLIGMLSKSVAMRGQLSSAQHLQTRLNSSKLGRKSRRRIQRELAKLPEEIVVTAARFSKQNVDIHPLHLVIMSATLQTKDFCNNPALFTPPPPVVSVSGRQFPVRKHFSKRTATGNYLQTTFQFLCKMHKRLPPGGILVFLPGRQSINDMCRKVAQRFNSSEGQAQDMRGLLGSHAESVDGEEKAPVDFDLALTSDEEGDAPAPAEGDGPATDVDSDTDSSEKVRWLEDDDKSLLQGTSTSNHGPEEQASVDDALAEGDARITANNSSLTVESALGGGDKSSKDAKMMDPVAIKTESSDDQHRNDQQNALSHSGNDAHGADSAPDEVHSTAADLPGEVDVFPLYSLLPTHLQMRVFGYTPDTSTHLVNNPAQGTDPTTDAPKDTRKPLEATAHPDDPCTQLIRAPRRLIVVATNIAETSLTIPHIRYVLDSGRAKKKLYHPATGLSRFVVDWVSQAAAEQRAGRAGRVAAGHCYRMYSSAVFQRYFPEQSPAEILTAPIDSTVLRMKTMGIRSVQEFPFPTPPSQSRVQAATRLLHRLGLLLRNRAFEKAWLRRNASQSHRSSGHTGSSSSDASTPGRNSCAPLHDRAFQVTPLGRVVGRFPLAPRMGKMVVMAVATSAWLRTLSATSSHATALQTGPGTAHTQLAALTAGDVNRLDLRPLSLQPNCSLDHAGGDWRFRVMSAARYVLPHMIAVVSAMCCEHLFWPDSSLSQLLPQLTSQDAGESRLGALRKARHQAVQGFSDPTSDLLGRLRVVAGFVQAGTLPDWVNPHAPGRSGCNPRRTDDGVASSARTASQKAQGEGKKQGQDETQAACAVCVKDLQRHVSAQRFSKLRRLVSKAQSAFVRDHFLMRKNIREVGQLRAQLTHTVHRLINNSWGDQDSSNSPDSRRADDRIDALENEELEDSAMLGASGTISVGGATASVSSQSHGTGQKMHVHCAFTVTRKRHSRTAQTPVQDLCVRVERTAASHPGTEWLAYAPVQDHHCPSLTSSLCLQRCLPALPREALTALRMLITAGLCDRVARRLPQATALSYYRNGLPRHAQSKSLLAEADRRSKNGHEASLWMHGNRGESKAPGDGEGVEGGYDEPRVLEQGELDGAYEILPPAPESGGAVSPVAGVVAFIHPGSALFPSSRQPDWLCYQTVQMSGSARKTYLRGCTAIDSAWLPLVAPNMCSFSARLSQPAPVYDSSTDQLCGFHRCFFGPVRWPLRTVRVPLMVASSTDSGELRTVRDGRSLCRSVDYVRHFCRLFLCGSIFPRMRQLRLCLRFNPEVILANDRCGRGASIPDLELPNACRPLLLSLNSVRKCTAKFLATQWQRQPSFLWECVQSWLQPQKIKLARDLWPPL